MRYHHRRAVAASESGARIGARRRSRKPAARGRERAFSVKVVERVVVQEHDLSECVRRVNGSPVAIGRVQYEFVEIVDADTVLHDPRWQRVQRAVEAMRDALDRRRWGSGSSRWHN